MILKMVTYYYNPIKFMTSELPNKPKPPEILIYVL